MVFLLRLPDLGPLFFGSGPADRRRAQTVPRKTARASILPPGRVEELSRHNDAVEKVLLTESRVPDRPLLVDHTGSNGRQRSITHPNSGRSWERLLAGNTFGRSRSQPSTGMRFKSDRTLTLPSSW